jgi:hypothetical protein
MRSAAVAAALLFVTTTARAEDDRCARDARGTAGGRYLFPGDGRIGATLATGAPFAAIGEISIGAGDRFAAGALVGAGPFSGGIVTGVRPRVDALHLGPTVSSSSCRCSGTRG